MAAAYSRGTLPDAGRTLAAPRRSKTTLIGGAILLLLTLIFLLFAYWGFQLHQALV